MIPLDIRRVVRDGVRDPEVDELELTFDEDEVGGFEVGVNDLLVVDDLDCLEHLHAQ